MMGMEREEKESKKEQKEYVKGKEEEIKVI